MGKSAIVDNKDYKWLSQYSWWVVKGFAHTKIKNEHIKMHRFILGLNNNNNKYLCVDHLNGDKLDNRRKNLKIRPYKYHLTNRPKRNGVTSKYKGVIWYRRIKKWVARIRIEGKLVLLGNYNNEEEAALAYDKKAIEIFGEFASLNFPCQQQQLLF